MRFCLLLNGRRLVITPFHNQAFFVGEFFQMAYEYSFDLFHVFHTVGNDVKREVTRCCRHVTGSERKCCESGGWCILRFNFMPEMAAQFADVLACCLGSDCCC